MSNPVDNSWFVENDNLCTPKVPCISFQLIYLQFVVVKDDVEVDLSVWLGDRFEFYSVTKVTGTSAKTNNYIDEYLFSQCC